MSSAVCRLRAGDTGKAGATIRVTASDDFEVVGVEVEHHRPNGTMLEHGAAMCRGTDATRTYQTTTAVPVGQQFSIVVTATNRLGHKTRKRKRKGS